MTTTPHPLLSLMDQAMHTRPDGPTRISRGAEDLPTPPGPELRLSAEILRIHRTVGALRGLHVLARRTDPQDAQELIDLNRDDLAALFSLLHDDLCGPLRSLDIAADGLAGREPDAPGATGA